MEQHRPRLTIVLLSLRVDAAADDNGNDDNGDGGGGGGGGGSGKDNKDRGDDTQKTIS